MIKLATNSKLKPIEMKMFFQFTFAVLFCLIFTNSSYSQSEEEMQKWMEYMTPGPMQEALSKMAGDWTAHTTLWMHPGAEPVNSQGSVTAEMIFGGRYLKMNHKGNMMGMPFEGMSIEGYDNALKTFVSIWIDNMGTGILYSTGIASDDGKTITYTGSMVDPLTAEKMTVRQIVLLNEDGTINFEMYMPFEGTEYKSMEIHYVR